MFHHSHPFHHRAVIRIAAMLLACTLGAAALELPGGTHAQLIAEPDSGFLLLQNGTRRYYLAVHALLGVQPKANGAGCTLLIQADQGVQLVDVATMPDDVLMALRISRPAPASTK
jgi:hypothetical protein